MCGPLAVVVGGVSPSTSPPLAYGSILSRVVHGDELIRCDISALGIAPFVAAY